MTYVYDPSGHVLRVYSEIMDQLNLTHRQTVDAETAIRIAELSLDIAFERVGWGIDA